VKPRRRKERVVRKVSNLNLAVRRDLLRVLSSPSDVRADLIRQMHERPDTRDLAEVLVDRSDEEVETCR
jgi:hypothetical protein